VKEEGFSAKESRGGEGEERTDRLEVQKGRRVVVLLLSLMWTFLESWEVRERLCSQR